MSLNNIVVTRDTDRNTPPETELTNWDIRKKIATAAYLHSKGHLIKATIATLLSSAATIGSPFLFSWFAEIASKEENQGIQNRYNFGIASIMAVSIGFGLICHVLKNDRIKRLARHISDKFLLEEANCLSRMHLTTQEVTKDYLRKKSIKLGSLSNHTLEALHANIEFIPAILEIIFSCSFISKNYEYRLSLLVCSSSVVIPLVNYCLLRIASVRNTVRQAPNDRNNVMLAFSHDLERFTPELTKTHDAEAKAANIRFLLDCLNIALLVIQIVGIIFFVLHEDEDRKSIYAGPDITYIFFNIMIIAWALKKIANCRIESHSNLSGMSHSTNSDGLVSAPVSRRGSVAINPASFHHYQPPLLSAAGASATTAPEGEEEKSSQRSPSP